MNKAIYTLIKAKLNNDLGSNTPDYMKLKHFSLWNEQVQDIRATTPENNKAIPFGFPAVFLEITPIKWNSNDVSNNMKSGTTTFRIHIVQQVMGEVSAAAQETRFLAQFDFVELVNAALQNYNTTAFDALDKVGEIIDHNHDSIREDVLEYNAIVYDYATAIAATNSTANNISLEIEKDNNITVNPAAVGSKFIVP